MIRKNLLILLIASIFLLSVNSSATADNTVLRLDQPVQQSIKIRQATQQEEESWRFEKEKLIAGYEELQKQQEQLKTRKEQLNQQIETTQTRLAAKEKQLTDIEQITAQVRPFLDGIINNIELQISDSLPFLATERNQRVEKLKTIMADPSIDISEKYRKVMEALLIEAEYGFTIETYQQTISFEKQTMLVNIFRLGRLSLFFQSLDQKHCGFYNLSTNTWQTLSGSYNRTIKTAIDIAAKQLPVELLTLPIGRIAKQ
ncbi:MAG: DUF3450 domain-containing protein [Proteobacteria bacterium]|nr:DUF3450 domain-containing protein [Pseudomonadota bacterium]